MTSVTPATVSVAPRFPSICGRKGSTNRAYWYSDSHAETIDDAFDQYVASKFYSPYQAAQAAEEFMDTMERAKRGDLEHVDEIRPINPATTEPETIYEIKTHWHNSKRSANTSGYLGARLFHGEPPQRPNTIIGVYLMCKSEYSDDDDEWLAQTGAAKSAAWRFDECRKKNWCDLHEI
ncbi:MAG: hypothetical protein ABF966_09650 [Bifidobacterium psychraerophilum]|uniref:hypothetical protein n=1 Tax=Bifidobacterium psychraerophilum TaxID=218140 RepID=UPI0039ED36B8